VNDDALHIFFVFATLIALVMLIAVRSG